MGYGVACFTEFTKATGGAHGGVGIFFRECPQGLSMDSTHFHRQNMGMYILDLKLAQGLASVNQDPLLLVFMDPC